jgi:hypothetical protein
MSDDLQTHKVHASYTIKTHDKTYSDVGVKAKQTFKVKAKSREHAINKVGAHLSKSKASNVSLKYAGVHEEKPKGPGEVVSLKDRGHYHRAEVKRLLGVKEKPKADPTEKLSHNPSKVVSLAVYKANKGKK